MIAFLSACAAFDMCIGISVLVATLSPLWLWVVCIVCEESV